MPAAGPSPPLVPSPPLADEAASAGIDLLGRLTAVDPPRYLAPSPELSRLARAAAASLFSFLAPHSPKPLPLERLLVDESFDAEQIWHQIDLLSQPLSRALRRQLKPFELMTAAEIKGLFGSSEEVKEVRSEDEDEEDEEEEDEDDEEEVEMEEEQEEMKEEEKKGGALDDGFFKGEELEEFLKEEEEREYGGKRSTKTGEDDEEEEDEDEDQSDGDDDSSDAAAYAKFDDFYVRKQGMAPGNAAKRNQKSSKEPKMNEEEDGSDMLGLGEESSDELEDEDDTHMENEDNETLSTFEKQSKRNQSKIEQIEKELIAPKSWTMIGEVTASKRPKNSALEVDLDFQHNRAPPPIMIEETAAAIEDIIIKRLREGPGHLDEVQRLVIVETKAAKELKELDDKKSQKGLAEIYEEDYARKTGIGAAPSSALDEQKKEATLLFKVLCLKLDALSHFHFKPKPVIEEMSVQTNVPALAMEEIAPLAVSDAAMLAPEEIFAGKGDIKEDVELTQIDRKRRRAKKKRKFKAESAKRIPKKKRVEAAAA